MSLESILTDITAKLRQGKFPNEQSISQSIVLRVLQELGWDIYDPTVVWPEFGTGEGRADCRKRQRRLVGLGFASAYRQALKPSVSETPRLRRARRANAVRQYAFHTGVPFIVLTDGRTWSFYLPAEQGSYEAEPHTGEVRRHDDVFVANRRVYKLDLYERPPTEAADILRRYLAHERVVSGEALEAARKEYRSRNRRTQACAAIPEAWRELVEKGNEDLVEMLASAVESKAGVRPEDNDVAEFLAALGKPVFVETASSKPPAEPAPRIGGPRGAGAEPRSMAASSARAGKLVLRSKAYPYHNAKDAMVIVLRELAKGDPTFLERCSQHPDAQGRKRRYIARTPEELYPDREDLREMRETLPGGWLVATNLNNILKRTIIKLAAEVAGLTFGKDVIVEF